MSGEDRGARDGDYEPRYDIQLTAIPAVFAVSYLLVAGHVAGWPMPLLVASIASGLVIVAALFIDPPVERAS